jgi:hypothetical protein
MGDYLKNGAKIGTCGRAYYATKKQLEKFANEEEVQYYLDPKKGCSFAFPFPEYDNKEAGQISNFHEGERAEYFFSLPANTGLHTQITHHIHPRGGEGINLFIDCPYKNPDIASRNFSKDFERFRLIEQGYHNEVLSVVVECVYCQQRQILEDKEVEMAANDFEKQSQNMFKISEREKWQWPDCSNWETSKEQAEKLQIVADRLKEMILIPA